MSAEGQLSESWQRYLGAALASAPMRGLSTFLRTIWHVVQCRMLALALHILAAKDRYVAEQFTLATSL